MTRVPVTSCTAILALWALQCGLWERQGRGRCGWKQGALPQCGGRENSFFCICTWACRRKVLWRAWVCVPSPISLPFLLAMTGRTWEADAQPECLPLTQWKARGVPRKPPTSLGPQGLQDANLHRAQQACTSL
jgi:hypothetical protein